MNSGTNSCNFLISGFTFPSLTSEKFTSTITGFSRIDDTTLTINIQQNLIVGKNERVCLAVQPTQTQNNISEGGYLYVEREAKDIFPQYHGAININRIDYVYESLIDEPANNRVRLENLTARMNHKN